MKYIAKPSVNPELPSMDYPDWIVFESGNFSKPMGIFSELEFKAIVIDYLKYHKFTVKGLTEK